VRSSPFFLYFLPLQSKYSPQHNSVEHPQCIEYVLPLSLTYMRLVILVFNEFCLVLKSDENLVLEVSRTQFCFSVFTVDYIRWDIALSCGIINCDLITGIA